ncbi:MAG TPA: antibiotic biosynthesis monooxygenase family protein [Tepidisphaeraceae bacterium]|jgi:quinol monooxygenase YgiN
MKVTRINEFRAKEGKAEALRTFLTSMIPTNTSSVGCLSCQLLQGHENPTRLVVLEVWENIEAHQTAVQQIPKEAFANVMELLDSAPVGTYYTGVVGEDTKVK